MSIIDLIMENQLIVLSITIGLLPLVLAILIVLLPRIRQLFRRIKLAREAKALEQASRLQSTSEHHSRHHVEQIDLDLVESDADDESDDTEEEAREEEQAEGESETPAENNAMQDLISSVFEDSGALEKFEVLLEEAQIVDIDSLLNLSQEIANQLRQSASASRGSA